MTVRQYISRFQSPIVRRLLSSVVPLDLPLNALFFTLGIRTSKDGGWPMGGSSQFTARIKQRFEELGGLIHTGKTVLCVY